MINAFVIMIALKGAVEEFLRSPHCAANCLQNVSSRGQGAIVCKLRATHLGTYHVQHVVCHVIQRHSSAVKFDKVKIAFILVLFYWLKRLTNKGGEETGVLGENP